MIYNFRFARDRRDEILRRLREHNELSQGWGGGLEGGLNMNEPRRDFIPRARERYELATTRVPSNLTRMRHFKDGDLLVTPHLPEYGKVSIHEVDGDYPACYRYEAGDSTHLNHRVRIRRSWGLDGNISAYHDSLVPWKAKLPWMRLPVLPIERFEDEFRKVLADLEAEPDAVLEPSDLEKFLAGVATDVREVIGKRLDAMPPSGGEVSFESVCERLLLAFGYKVLRRNHYDGKGGDVDLVCARERADASPFESGDVNLFVQVKKHVGTTGQMAVNQVVDMLEEGEAQDGCVVSLADEYSEEATSLAEDNGITLLARPQVCALVLQELVKEGASDTADG